MNAGLTRRAVAVSAHLLVITGFVVLTCMFVGDWDEGPWVAVLPLISALIAASALVAFMLLLALVLPSFRLRVRDRKVVVVLTVGTASLLLALPLPIGWNDGCNDHRSDMPVLGVAHALIARPARPLAYIDESTLVGCRSDPHGYFLGH